MNIKLKHIDTVPPGLEYDATHYPSSGIYMVAPGPGTVAAHMVMVCKETNITSTMGVMEMNHIMNNSETDDAIQKPIPSGHISEDGVLKLLAILQNPENAKELLS